VLFATTSNQVPSMNLGNYNNEDPRDEDEFDLQNANVGKKQTVQIGSLATGNQIKVYVVVLDSSDSFTYSITVTEHTSITSLCTFGPKALLNKQYCSDCVG
jgi:hypothetical protein